MLKPQVAFRRLSKAVAVACLTRILDATPGLKVFRHTVSQYRLVGSKQ